MKCDLLLPYPPLPPPPCIFKETVMLSEKYIYYWSDLYGTSHAHVELNFKKKHFIGDNFSIFGKEFVLIHLKNGRTNAVSQF